MRSPGKHYRHLRRYQEIARVLVRHGFGDLVDQLGLVRALSVPRRLLQREAELPPLSRPEHLRLAIEELGPTFIKLGQILSTRPDLIPPAYIREMAKLQDVVAPSPWEAVRARIEEELDTPLDEVFSSFEPEPIAAASLAQVYGATLPGGEEVVVKAQRPDIERVIDTDLEILFDLARLLQQRTPLGEIYDLEEIAEDFAYTLRNELNFRREGRNADRFRVNFAEESHLYIPRVYWDYTSQGVIVFERISGIKIDDIEALDAAGIDRHQVALHASRIIIKEALIDGFFHADPHPGNFFVMCRDGDPDQPVIGAMDFGMVGHLSTRLRQELVRLYVVSVRLDSEGIVEQLIRMGAARHRVDREGLRRDLDRLLTKYYGLPLKDIQAREVVEEVMPIAFRHHLHLPSELWLLGKTLGMMEGMGLKLDPDLDIFEVSSPYVHRLAWQMASPLVWGRKVAKSAGDWGEFLALLPRQAPRLLDQLAHGELGFSVDVGEIDRVLGRVDQVGNRLAVSVLLAAFIVALALLIPLAVEAGRGLAFWIMMAGFIAASLLGMSLLYSIWRAGR